MKGKITAVLFLSAALMLSACGNSENAKGASAENSIETTKKTADTEAGSEDTKARKVTEKAETAAMETEESNTEENVAEETTSRSKKDIADEEQTKYYELLDAEYAEEGYIKDHVADSYSYRFIKDGNMIYFSSHDSQWYSYNIDTKECSEFFSVYEPEYFIGYYNGNFYIQRDREIVKYNNKGEFESRFDPSLSGLGIENVSGRAYIKNYNENTVLDSKAFLSVVSGSDGGIVSKKTSGLFLISPDLDIISKLTHFWLETPGEHGTTDKVYPNFAFTNNENVYAYYKENNELFSKTFKYSKYRIYKYDLTANELKETDNYLQIAGTYRPDNLAIHSGDIINYYPITGKYCVIRGPEEKNNIVDMETGEIIASLHDENLKNFPSTYFGNGCNVIRSNNAWLKVAFYGNGEKARKKIERMGTETAEDRYIAQLDDTYYVVVDSYGIFLRTYEKGDSEEEAIMRFK